MTGLWILPKSMLFAPRRTRNHSGEGAGEALRVSSNQRRRSMLASRVSAGLVSCMEAYEWSSAASENGEALCGSGDPLQAWTPAYLFSSSDSLWHLRNGR